VKVLLLMLAAVAATLAAHWWLTARRRGREVPEDLLRELDRLENILRRDPYRDDIRALYEDLCRRAGPGKRRRGQD